VVPAAAQRDERGTGTHRAAVEREIGYDQARKAPGVPSEQIAERPFASCERRYSGSAMPDPPISAGKSLSLGSPSFMGSTVSA